MSELSISQHDSILAAWIRAETTMPTQRQHEDFRQLLDWARWYDIAMPLSGEEVATYLLELMADGAALPDIKRAAKSIEACYAQRRCFLDIAPIKAALAIVAAQTSPDRTLN
jgi:hypothetical protein